MSIRSYGGHHIIIDFEKSKIIATNVMQENFNYEK